MSSVIALGPEQVRSELLRSIEGNATPTHHFGGRKAPSFMAFAHHSGSHSFRGGVPFFISKEIPISRGASNRAGAAQTIWVMIDDEIRIFGAGDSRLPITQVTCA